MSDKALKQLVTDVRAACDRYLAAQRVELLPPTAEAKAIVARSKSVKGNPLCKCRHNYSVHDEPRDVGGIPQNICRGCAAEDGALGCPEFVSKRGGAIVTTREPGMPPKPLNGAHEVSEGLQPVHGAILAALAAKPEKTAQQVAIISVYVQSGTFNSAIADLRDLGLVEGSPLLQLTTAGKRMAVDIGRRYDAKTLRAEWSAKFGVLGRVIIAELHENGSVASSAELAALCKYVQSGTFNSAIAKMRRMGLVAKKLPLRLCAELT